MAVRVRGKKLLIRFPLLLPDGRKYDAESNRAQR